MLPPHERFSTMPSKATHILESVLIVIALVSLWPLIWPGPMFVDPKGLWYRVWLVLMLGAMAWVASRRLARVRAAADEAKRLRDEMERTGRPPLLKG